MRLASAGPGGARAALLQRRAQPLRDAPRRSAPVAARASGSGDSTPAPEPLPAALGERLARLRALESYSSLLTASDVLAPAAAAAPRAASASAAPEESTSSSSGGARPPLDLLAATLLIARHARPGLDAAAAEAELARLAAAAEARLPPGGPRYPLALVKVGCLLPAETPLGSCAMLLRAVLCFTALYALHAWHAPCPRCITA